MGWPAGGPPTTRPAARSARSTRCGSPTPPWPGSSESTRRFPARSWPATASAAPRSGSAPTSASPSNRRPKAAPGCCSTSSSTLTAASRHRSSASNPHSAAPRGWVAEGKEGLMDVDVLTDIEIERPRSEVADYVSDPDNATAWYENIKKVEWKSPKALKIGAKVAFEARFMGRTMAYTYEIKEYVPGQSLVMSTAAGPFPMETSYTFSDTPSGATIVELRNRGRPSGFGTIVAPAMAGAMKRANRKDLARLKSILESERS